MHAHRLWVGRVLAAWPADGEALAGRAMCHYGGASRDVWSPLHLILLILEWRRQLLRLGAFLQGPMPSAAAAAAVAWLRLSASELSVGHYM
jgi:hypothetical protein